MGKRIIKTLAASAIVLAAGVRQSPAAGVMLNVDFNGGNGPTYSGAGAAPITGTYWNGFPVTGRDTPAYPLLQADGVTPSNIGVYLRFLGGGGDPNVGGFNYGTISPLNNLFDDYAFKFGSDPAEFNLDGVPTGLYDLYLYSENGNANNGEATRFSIDGVTKDAVPGTPTATFIEGRNYVVYHNLAVGSGLKIQGTFLDIGGSAATLNGLQLISVPEPATLGAFAMAGLGLHRRRRRS